MDFQSLRDVLFRQLFPLKKRIKISLFSESLFLEFRPGEPWKGYPNIDPETDPYVTPGSVINNLSINTVREVDHLRDRNSGMFRCYVFELCTSLPSVTQRDCLLGDVCYLLISLFIFCIVDFMAEKLIFGSSIAT